MMRVPSDRWTMWSWWRQAHVCSEDVIIVMDDPQCGFYKTKQHKGGTWVPASIDLYQEIDPETGELLTDEQFVCFVNGQERDAREMWSYLSGRPISEAEYERLQRTAHLFVNVTDLSRTVVV